MHADAERDRLLYVAATRARDHLLVSLFHAGERIDRPRARTSIAARIDIATWVVIGVLDAPEIPSRSGGLALLGSW